MIDHLDAITVVVSNQDKALDYYTNTLGFDKRMDDEMPDYGRFLMVGPPKGQAGIVLFPENDEDEVVAIGVLELGLHPPGLLSRGLYEVNTLGSRILISTLDIIGEEDPAEHADELLLVAAWEWHSQSHAGLGFRRRDLDPAIVIHGLIADLLKSQLPNVEVEGMILVGDVDRRKANLGNHGLFPSSIVGNIAVHT